MDVTIVANIENPSNQLVEGDDFPVLSLSQLCQTKFSLEMNKSSNKWRPNYGPGSASNRAEQNLVVIELRCITRNILLQIQNGTTLNMDNFLESCEDIEERIDKCVQAQTLVLNMPIQEKQPLLQVNEKTSNKQVDNDEELQTHLVSLDERTQEDGTLDIVENDMAQLDDQMENESVAPAEQPSKSNSQLDDEQLEKVASISSAFMVLMVLLMRLVANMLSSSVLYTKRFASKIMQLFGLKETLVKPTEKVCPSSLD